MTADQPKGKTMLKATFKAHRHLDPNGKRMAEVLATEARREAMVRLVEAWNLACGCKRPRRRPVADPEPTVRTHWISSKDRPAKPRGGG